jgi:hypothetical protein
MKDMRIPTSRYAEVCVPRIQACTYCNYVIRKELSQKRETGMRKNSIEIYGGK